MNQGPSNFTNVEVIVSFTPFKSIFELLWKLNKMRYSPILRYSPSLILKIHVNSKRLRLSLLSLILKIHVNLKRLRFDGII